MASDRLEENRELSKASPRAYRQGSAGKQMGQGESFAAFADSLLLRQITASFLRQ
jgi:hypothetical protein